MRRKIVAGNWKMNGDRDEALGLATEIKGMVADEITSEVMVVLAPPFVHIPAVSMLIAGSGIGVAAQNCSSESKGAYTGEVSVSMLRSVGAGWVIVGHSERRSLFFESNELLRKKVSLVLDAGLQLIFCCGETLAEREAGHHFQTVSDQLRDSLFQVDPSQLNQVVIAYEPVWAIGTGKTATPEQAQEMHAFIRKSVSDRYGSKAAASISLLYGGSCNEQNASTLFSMPDVDGGLIGGASLNSRSFVKIIKSFPA